MASARGGGGGGTSTDVSASVNEEEGDEETKKAKRGLTTKGPKYWRPAIGADPLSFTLICFVYPNTVLMAFPIQHLLPSCASFIDSPPA